MTEYEALEVKICQLIELALSDKSSSDQISFPLPKEAVQRAWRKSFIDIRGYTCVIRANEIRHVKKEHGEDV